MSNDPQETDYHVPLATLEGSVHVPQEELVESQGEDPAPDLVPEERRRLEALLKFGTQG